MNKEKKYREWIDGLPSSQRMDLKIKIAAQLLNRHWQSILNEFDLTIGQWSILSVINETEGTTYSEIKDRLQQLGGTTSSIVNELDARLLVLRKQDGIDKRIWRIFFTQTGSELMKKVVPIEENHRREIYAGFTEQQEQDLSQTLDLLVHRLLTLQHNKLRSENN